MSVRACFPLSEEVRGRQGGQFIILEFEGRGGYASGSGYVDGVVGASILRREPAQRKELILYVPGNKRSVCLFCFSFRTFVLRFRCVVGGVEIEPGR